MAGRRSTTRRTPLRMTVNGSARHAQLLTNHGRQMDLRRFSTICLISTLVCGCGIQENASPLADVAGKVTWNGKPVAGCSVTLVPLSETSGWGAQATTNDAGEYQLLEGKTGRPGVRAGTYRVVLSRRLMPDGTSVPANDRTPPIESPARESLPPEYSDRQKSKLQITIPSQGGQFDFSLPNQS